MGVIRSMSISEYYLGAFRGDLAAFVGTSSLPYFGHSWHHGCPGLERISADSRASFLICLYFTVLVDQGMHAHCGAYYERFARLTQYPKFCHGLGQFQRNPRAILSVPIEQGLVGREELHALLDPGMELFVVETTSFFREHMPEISSADFFRALEYDPDVQIPMLVVMLDKSVAETTDYRVYAALKRAIKESVGEQNV